jgi:hypothetical protein
MRMIVTLLLLCMTASCSLFNPYTRAGWVLNDSNDNSTYCWHRATHATGSGDAQPACYEPGYGQALMACQSKLRTLQKASVSVDAAKGELMECMAASGWKRERFVINY